MILKGNWIYTVISVVIACAIATLQGAESVMFGAAVIAYTCVVLLIIKVYRFELHLPMRIEEVPDLRF